MQIIPRLRFHILNSGLSFSGAAPKEKYQKFIEESLLKA
jgi:hypothetical protein